MSKKKHVRPRIQMKKVNVNLFRKESSSLKSTSKKPLKRTGKNFETKSEQSLNNKLNPDRIFFRQYDLIKAKAIGSMELENDEPFQTEALSHFSKWYENHKSHSDLAGEILFLPTGAGKTHVAIRFLCIKPLSDGYKVLWLAHTHHLLEQAFYSFEKHLMLIAEPKQTLSVRVVSGTKGHFRAHAIKPSDDVIVATLQTITKAYSESHPALMNFLGSSEGKIFVVFDEAHHAPAPSYRQLILSLRERFPQMYLLGLTATPSYSNEKEEGWLARIFPQKFHPFITASELMAQGVLAKPIPVPVKTEITPDFDEREYKKWMGSFHERLPEEIIKKLALNKDRNLKIAKHYVENIREYGKTIIFADRWYQCEEISKFLENQGVKTGTLYTHIDADPEGNADARNKRRANENDLVLESFRRDEIQVILNVRILTEGTNIPDAKTVFITMQTTSQNLLTQMVGRALRGPKFGGKEQAYLVFFIDNWQELINWADYKPLVDTIIETPKPIRPYVPIEPISIELVRKLADMMYQDITKMDPFTTLLPAGWYQVEYIARTGNSDLTKEDDVTYNSIESDISDGKFADSEEIETVRRLVLVFDHEIDDYKDLIEFLIKSPPTILEEEGVQFKDVESNVAAWQKTFFANAKEHFGSNLAQDIFNIARHISQNNEQPKFFEFKERDLHDLEGIAKDVLNKNYTYDQAYDFLMNEYQNDKRYWNVFYPSFDQFYKQFNLYVGKIKLLRTKQPEDKKTTIIGKEEVPDDEEPPEYVKIELIKRDGRCLCCGSTRSKQVDHILSKHDGGSHQISNLQTLCKKCNELKKEKYIDFRATSFCESVDNFEKQNLADRIPPEHQPPKGMPSKSLMELDLPSANRIGDPLEWKRFVRGTINFFYQCGAVNNVFIERKGDSFHHWKIELNTGNDPKWIKPHLKDLLNRVVKTKQSKGYGAPSSITISAPNKPSVNFTQKIR